MRLAVGHETESPVCCYRVENCIEVEIENVNRVNWETNLGLCGLVSKHTNLETYRTDLNLKNYWR